jgi:hypothetical protein
MNFKGQMCQISCNQSSWYFIFLYNLIYLKILVVHFVLPQKVVTSTCCPFKVKAMDLERFFV